MCDVCTQQMFAASDAMPKPFWGRRGGGRFLHIDFFEDKTLPHLFCVGVYQALTAGSIVLEL